MSKPLHSSQDCTIPIHTGTHSVLDFIKSVIKETHTPSWLGSVPQNFGDRKTGTLKADEWRIFSTLYLPIALVLLWGKNSEHKSAAIADSLDIKLEHTMHLVQALTLACYRATTETRIDGIGHNLRNYLTDLPKVHPDARPSTNQHISLHLSSYMRLFGPVHSWWTYPFERLIGRLQQSPSNNRLGALLFISHIQIL